jgi:REP element-mobilizing transposase RayT/DNA-directed RNA polymerase specialized sigma24 family protein
MNRGARRAPIFRDAADCQLFLDWVAESVSRHGIEVHLFCLMPNHFHLLIRSKRGNLSKALKHLLAGYVLELNRRHKWDGPVFRGRFQSQRIEDPDYLRYLVAYLHLNPVDAGIVACPHESPWSSARYYCAGASVPPWLKTTEVLTWFGSVEELERYVGECASGERPPPEDFNPDSGLFRSLETIPAPGRVGTTRRDEDARLMDARIQSLTDALGVSREALFRVRRGRNGNPQRHRAIWTLASEFGLSCGEIAEHLRCTPNAISKVLIKIRESERAGGSPERLVSLVEVSQKRESGGS